MNSPLQPSDGQADAAGTLIKYRDGGMFTGFALIELRAVMLADDQEDSGDGFDMHYCVRTIQFCTGQALGLSQTCSVRTVTEMYHHHLEVAEQQCEYATASFLRMVPGAWMEEQWKTP